MPTPKQASPDPNFMLSLARGLDVLMAFSGQQHPLSAAQLARRSGLPRASVGRCLHTLCVLGYVAAVDERLFALTPKVLSFGFAFLSGSHLARLAPTFLDKLAQRTGESSSVATLEGTEIAYVARTKNRNRIMSIDLSIGSRLPAFCTSMGRVLLAALPRAECEARLSEASRERRTAHTVTSLRALMRILDGVRRQNYAMVDEELEIGLRSVAVPIRNRRGDVVAAVNIGTQTSQCERETLTERLLPMLRETADAFGQML